MSASSLELFLKKLQSELERTKGPYRELIANVRPHVYKFRVGDLVTETLKQFKKQNIVITEEEKAVITTFSEEMKSGLEWNLRQLEGLVGGDLKVTDRTITLRFTSEVDTGKIFSLKNKSSKYSKPDSVFHKIIDFYKPELEIYFEKVQDYLATQFMVNEKTGRKKAKYLRTRGGKGRRKYGVQHVFDTGHIGEAGILQSRIADAFSAASLGIIDEADSEALSDLMSDLKQLGVNLVIMRDDSTDSHTVQVEASSRNRRAGALIRQKSKKLEAQIQSAINKLEGKYGPSLIDLKGSDTLRTKKRKESIDKVMEPLSKLKKPKAGSLKITKEDTARKPSSKGPKKKTSSRQAQRGRRKSYGAVKAGVTSKQGTTKTTNQPGIASKPLALVQEINRRLPAEIVKNMEAPGLINRTERFASSVKILDVIQTPKGYPSFGYTYLKYPYQTFEPGQKQGSVDRDPRRLIDRTIREIAAEYAVGRLFTRRL